MLSKIKNTIKRSKLYFRYRKKSYYRKYRINPKLAEDGKILEELINEGLVIIPDFLSDSVIEKIRQECKNHLSDIRKNRYKLTPHWYLPEHGTYRILEADNISSTSKLFFDNSLINSIAKAYVSKDVVSYQRMVELKPDITTKSISDDYHMDDWKQRFKAFLYLTDVGKDNAPFVYIKKTHNTKDSWRFEKEHDYFLNGYDGDHGYFSSKQVKALCHDSSFEKVVCTGSKGTLILTDTRGLHRGSTLLKDSRLLLANYFDVR